ncbi:MAG: acetyl-CoA C-acetyltransferase [Candidatus Eisenbacteria bacterium]|uniref:Acetyl-CoA C-acetyltransferase n=1 Tax=Eiseniibacteriota bacterium TaxID=2212470 RepID=A0A7Y2E5U2_UNCEI|nr:acetyl-CoA C-acetyltransferase [Candidatus Eisenbacteria bacterium]
MKQAVIVSAVRTPVGKFMGGLSSIPAGKLGAHVVAEAIKRAGIDAKEIEECIMGNVLQAGVGQNPARQAAHWGGVPDEVGSFTVNKVCGSGLKAVMLAAQAIKAGDHDVIVAGGMESMSNAPYLLPKARTGYRLGHGKLVDAMVHDGLWEVYNDYHMGNAAEFIADKFKVTREDQDEFAANSQQKAVAAIEAGKFKDEILPVEVPQRKGDPLVVANDEGPRPGTTAEKLAALKPAFQKGGTVTAGNAPSVNDGASALLVMSEDKAKELGAPIMAKINGYATGGTEPEMLFYAPVVAVRKLMKQMNVDINHWDLIEANEAFSAQALVDGRELEWDWDRVNVNGGAVALGHPIGASGARVLTTLLYALKDRGKKHGMATLCLGGGNAVALSVEMV